VIDDHCFCYKLLMVKSEFCTVRLSRTVSSRKGKRGRGKKDLGTGTRDVATRDEA